MPTFKWTGQNEAGYVVMGGIKFEQGVPVQVNDPHQASKLEGHPEFEAVDIASGAADLGPVMNPPGPTVLGSGPGTGPYQTTHEVVDANPDAVPEPPPPEEPPAEEPPPEPGPETDPFAAEVTEEGPRKKKK